VTSPAFELAQLLDADLRPAVKITTAAGRTVEVARYLRHEVRLPSPVQRTSRCWAPNKPAIDFAGQATFAELVVVGLLKRAGWDARWIKNWGTGIEPCVAPGHRLPIPDHVVRRTQPIHSSLPHLKGAGAWDVLGWRGDELLFIESKQFRSSDRLNANQVAWLEAACQLGFPGSSFAIVEYDARLVVEPDAHGLSHRAESRSATTVSSNPAGAGTDDLDGLSTLIQTRNAVDAEIAQLIGRPASLGNIGEFIAARVFDISMASSGVNPGHDGVFTRGPLLGMTVNVKLYAHDAGLLDISSHPVDFYLVLTGPRPATSIGPRALPIRVEAVYLFDASALLNALAISGVRVGVATSVRREQWEAARIFPPRPGAPLPLDERQLQILGALGGER
jgi:hypothetical protein